MKVVILFPGYGGQFVGMAKELYDDYRSVQEYFEQASQCLNINFVKLCFSSSEAELAKIKNAYPVLFLISYSIYALFKDEKIEPSILVGNNIGDYAAIAAAGGMSLPDGLYLLNKYATFYEDFLAMHDIVFLRVEQTALADVEKICARVSNDEQQVSIAIHWSDTEHTLSGNKKAISSFKKIADENAIAYVDEDDGYEVHSFLAQPLADGFKQYLNKVDLKDTTIPVMRSSDGQEVSTKEEFEKTMIDRITQPVRLDSVHAKISDADLIVHFGMEDRQTTILNELYPKIPLMLINQRSDIMEVKKIIEIKTQAEK